ncbi:MAG: hypothetical protein V2J25_13020 [Desulfatiglans sp.]|jgi:hypothetical protein|nr:hypothetical protein [Desulfatiglans sp.]
MKKTGFYLLLILTTSVGLFGSNCSRMEAKMTTHKSPPFVDGGSCTYVSYDGNAQIVRVKQSQASLAQAKVLGGPGYGGYEVWFRFVPGPDVSSEQIKDYTSREYLFTLSNSWYVGPRYLKKYRIEAGRKYPCLLKLLKKGTCSPLVFEFKDINMSDYFESRP